MADHNRNCDTVIATRVLHLRESGRASWLEESKVSTLAPVFVSRDQCFPHIVYLLVVSPWHYHSNGEISGM